MDSKKTHRSKVLFLLPMVAWLFLSVNAQPSNATAKIEKQDAPMLNNLYNAGHIQNNNQNLSHPVDVHHRSKRYFNGEIMNAILRPLLPTYFGTKWCGDNPRETWDTRNLGLFGQTDSCCQAHYICTQRKKQIINYKYPGSYRGVFRSCLCDDAFYKCLTNVQPVLSSKKHIIIGEDYFNQRAPQCFADRKPIGECLRYQNPNGPDRRCISYDTFYNEPNELVLMDNPRFQLQTNLT